MANEGYIDLGAQQANQELREMVSLVKAVADEIKTIRIDVRGGAGIEQQIRNLNNLSRAQANYDRAAANAARAADLNARAAERQANIDLRRQRLLDMQTRAQERANRESERAVEAANRQAQAAARVAAQNNIAYDSITAMSRTLAEHRKSYNLLTQAERENEHIGGVLLARIRELDAAVKKADYSQGVFTRNVGNYSSAFNGLGFSIRNIASELPNLGISFRTFAQAVSNNIGPLAQEIGALRTQNRQLAAEGKPTVSIGKQIASSLFSVQTAILVVVAAGTYLASNLSRGNKAMQEATKANEKYRDTLKSVEVETRKSILAESTRLEALIKTAKDTSLAMKTRNDAVKELQSEFPEYFGNLKSEAILNGDVANAVNRTKDAILARVKATAGYRLLDSLEEQMGPFIEQVTDLSTKLAELRKTSREFLEGFGQLPGAKAIPITDEVLQNYLDQNVEYQNLIGQYRDANQELTKLKGQQDKVIKDINRNTAISPGKGGVTNDPKPKKEKEDNRLEELLETIEEVKVAFREISDESITNTINSIFSEGLAKDQTLFLLPSRLKKASEEIKTQSEQTAREYVAAMQRVEEAYQSGTISNATAYQKAKKQVEDTFEERRYNDAVEANRRLMEIPGTTPEDAKKYADEIAKAKLDRIRKANEQELAEEKKKQEGIRKLDEVRLRAFQEGAQATNEIVSGIYSSQLQAQQQLTQQTRDRFEQEIALAQVSGKSEKEIQADIADIRARAAIAERENIERENQLRRRQAVADRAASIARIVQGTATAIMEVVGIPGYGQIAAGIIAGIGAAQLAAVLAQPLPAYFKGTPPGGHPADGPALVSEKGIELGQKKDGSLFLTPANPSIIPLEKGDKIFPHEILMQLAGGLLAPSVIAGINAKSQDVALNKVIGDKLDRIADIYANKPLLINNINQRGVSLVVQIENKKTEYLYKNGFIKRRR